MSSIPSYGRTPSPRPRPPVGERPRALLPTLLIVVAVVVALTVFIELWTDRLWFTSVGYASVFNTVLVTRLVLFAVFGALLAAVVVGNVWLAYRLRPPAYPTSLEQQSLDRYREALHPRRRFVLAAAAVVLTVFGGTRAAGGWQTYLLWRNGGSFGVNDQFFQRDISFFVFDYPFYRMLVGYGFTIVVLSVIAVLVTNYLYGGLRMQAPLGQRISTAAQGHLSVLLGCFVLLKAVAYWLDRYGLATSGGRLFTGISFTDENALLPAKNILMVIALICAILFFANVVRRTWMLPTIGLGLLVLSAVLLGGLWPAFVQQVQVKPSEPDKEAPYIQKNITATRLAYGVDEVEVTNYDATTDIGPEQLRQDAENLPGTRLLDPSLVSPAFDQLQQVRGFYSVPDVLDVDRYTVDGESRDMVVALREIDLSGLPAQQRNWNNDHTVYTHGYGMVAAYGNERTADGEPVWAESDLPPRGVLGPYEPRIYFGELTPEYSIVGAPKGTPPVEIDLPDVEDTGAPQTNTYNGKGGVPVGGLFNKLLYTAKFWEPSILLSGRVNSASQILYDRSPRVRVEKVAPWLTVDGDPYPAVVDERLVWIVDGYTTSGEYPMSERVTLDTATSDSLTRRQAYAAQAQEQVNYIRNSVKAVVDAYDGTVALYAWDESDPILKAWRAAFPNVVKARSDIPPGVLEHLRYPEDMFKVQREILTQYHVEDPTTFYGATDRWRVPEDPTVTSGTISQPPYFLSVRLPGQDEPAFSLTSVYVPQNKDNIASFIAVDAEASSPDYGTIRILRLPGNTQIAGPGQISNAFIADRDISTALLPFKQSNTQALFGNLLTLPVSDGLLYVQPVYTLRPGTAGSYPVLQLVLASFGSKVGFGNTLNEALNVVLGTSPSGTPGGGTTPPPPGPGGPPTPGTGDALSLLQQADAKYAEAREALANQDLAGYQAATEQAQSLVQQALAQLQGESPSSPGATGSSPSPAPTASPTG